jgi:hypothetical protein
MADTQNVKAIDQWIGQIEAMKALKPEQVIRLILQNNLCLLSLWILLKTILRTTKRL